MPVSGLDVVVVSAGQSAPGGRVGCDLAREDRARGVQRLITAPELHLFFAPSRDEVEWLRSAQPCYAPLGPQRIPMYTLPVPSISAEEITGM